MFYFCAFIRIFIDRKFMGLFVLLQIFIEIYYDSYERSTLKALQFVCFNSSSYLSSRPIPKAGEKNAAMRH